MSQTPHRQALQDGASQAVRLPAEFRSRETRSTSRATNALRTSSLSKRPGARVWEEFFAFMRTVTSRRIG